MTTPALSAYVPCFNNVATIRRAVESVVRQTIPPAQVIVVDDGSTDASADALRGLDVTVIRHESNRGRGAARASAMLEARHDLVLCCDATNVLEPAFVEKALPWLDDPKVAAVIGRFSQPPARTVADRWRGRHLFKLDAPAQVTRHSALGTYGAVVRASAAAAVGGYDPRLRHTEDGDLGERLRAAGFEIVRDPGLDVTCIVSNSVWAVLERYWRWYAGTEEAVSWHGYWKNVGYSIKGMAAADLRARDPLSVPVSLLTPHYQFWRSVIRRRSRPAWRA